MTHETARVAMPAFVEGERAHLEAKFSPDACERLARAERDYYSTHGEYIVPLAMLVNAVRAEREELRIALEAVRDEADESARTGRAPNGFTIARIATEALAAGAGS